MAMLVKIQLERLLAESPVNQKEIRQVIFKCLETIVGNPASKYSVEFLWVPFKTALNSPIVQVKATCLDSLNKLIAFNIFGGATTVFNEQNEEFLDHLRPNLFGQEECHIPAKEGILILDEIKNLQIMTCKLLLTCTVNPNLIFHGVSLIYSLNLAFRILIDSDTDKVKWTTAKATLIQMINTFFQKLRLKSRGENFCAKDFQTDTILIIRYLCQVGHLPDNDVAAVAVSLLNASLLYTDMPMFLDSNFSKVLKGNVCPLLLHLGSATRHDILEDTILIGFSLLKFHHTYLKPEIESLFLNIYFKILENAGNKKEANFVVDFFSKICSEPQLLLDLYVNYDCDPCMESLYEKFAFELCRIPALDCLKLLVESLMQWCLNKREGLDIGNNVSDVLVSPIDSDTIILDEQSSRKRLLKDLISEFNKSPIKTIQKFINNGFCLEDSKSVAEFILHEKSLSKKAIGELLGENDSFFIKVMHSFVDQLDFREMKFVTALRSFLQKFRLPGESQKIDRLMEKFAERYVACNPSVFSTADTAYTLAYSIIMLNTDQHSKQVKKKMDKSAFIKNNRGINNNKDLPDVFLEEIFNEISENEIVLEDERNIRRSSFILNQPISIKVTKQKGTPSEYQKAKSVDHVKYMFSSIHKEMIACIEKEYETNGGFKYLEIYPACLNICSLFGLVLERDSIIESLKKLSTLKGKSTEAMKAIINLGNYFGNFLDANWAHVLETVATIESSNSIDDFNEFENQNLLVSIDRIFSHSVDLDGEAIIYFFTALIGTYKKIDESRLVSLRRVVG
ncbi:Sec7-domain-containing protein, partial [Rozella allomycis CSF55]